jgi:ABC-type molybdate transport system substrate-binding protein
MKNIVRALVVVLAITGAAASTQVSSASTSKVIVGKTRALTNPMCAPDDPNACHIDGK